MLLLLLVLYMHLHVLLMGLSLRGPASCLQLAGELVSSMYGRQLAASWQQCSCIDTSQVWRRHQQLFINAVSGAGIAYA